MRTFCHGVHVAFCSDRLVGRATLDSETLEGSHDGSQADVEAGYVVREVEGYDQCRISKTSVEMLLELGC